MVGFDDAASGLSGAGVMVEIGWAAVARLDWGGVKFEGREAEGHR